ncbi:MAG TPA: isocitrate lyase/phosphoenolpyruvate mutase family protein [Streptosporangiaceae bacterium]
MTDRYARFRALHHAAEPLLLPNAWDYASAAALVDAGFAAIATTSLGVAAAAGKPDAHGATLPENLALATAAARLPCLLSVDIEAGFGADPAGVAAVVERLAEVGVVGVNVEDGRPDGTLADPSPQADTIRAIKSRVPDLFVNARTDAYWLRVDRPLPEALSRTEVFAGAGADGVFVPGIAADEDISALVAHAPVPVNVLFIAGRHTLPGLAALGVHRVSLGSLLFRAALHATVQAARDIADGRPITAGLPSYGDVVSLIGGG